MFYFQCEKKQNKTNNFFSCLETEQYISLHREKIDKQNENEAILTMGRQGQAELKQWIILPLGLSLSEFFWKLSVSYISFFKWF